MRTIYKYPIQITDHQVLELPACGQFLHVGHDPSGQACAWAEVTPTNEKVRIEIFVIGTGNPIPHQYLNFIGSFVDGPFVWHVYSRLEGKKTPV